MKLDRTVQWTLTLDTTELRLILKALGNRLTTPEGQAEAMALGDRLTTLRANQLQAMATTASQRDTALQMSHGTEG